MSGRRRTRRLALAGAVLALAAATPAAADLGGPVVATRYEFRIDGPSGPLEVTGRVTVRSEDVGAFAVAVAPRTGADDRPVALSSAYLTVFGTPYASAERASVMGEQVLVPACEPPVTCTIRRAGRTELLFRVLLTPTEEVAHQTVYLLARGSIEGIRVRAGRWRMTRAPGAFTLVTDAADDASVVTAERGGRTTNAPYLRVPPRRGPSLAIAGTGCADGDVAVAVLANAAGPVAHQACPGGQAHAFATEPTGWSLLGGAHRAGGRPVALLVADV